MKLSPIDRVYGKVRLRILDVDGDPAVPGSVDLAVLAFSTKPTASTTWTTTTYTPYATPDSDGYTGEIQPLFAGPAANPTGALPIPTAGASLWVRVTDNPEQQAVVAGFVAIT